MSDKEPKTAKPKYGVRKIKNKHIDLEPTTQSLRESKENLIDELIRFGLGDPGKLAFYRKAYMSPSTAVTDPQLRGMVADGLGKLLNMITSDPQILILVRKTLQQNYGKKNSAFMEGAGDILEQALKLREARDPHGFDKLRKKRVHKRHPRPPVDPGA